MPKAVAHEPFVGAPLRGARLRRGRAGCVLGRRAPPPSAEGPGVAPRAGVSLRQSRIRKAAPRLSVTLQPIGIFSRNLNLSIDFFALVMIGFCPVINSKANMAAIICFLSTTAFLPIPVFKVI